MVGPRQRPPITGSSDDDDDSSKVTWDELGDIMHLARRASMSSQNPSAMPTIAAAEAASASDDINDSGGHTAATSASATAGGGTSSQSSGTSEPSEQQIFTPRQIQNRHTMPTKLNHSLRSQTSTEGGDNITALASSRSSRGDHNLRGSDTSWDDLQDEIATAMRQSMMVGGSGSGDYQFNPTRGRAAGSFATKNTTTASNDNNGSGGTHHTHNDNSSLSSPPSSPPRHTTTSNTNDGGSPDSIIGNGGNTNNNQTNSQGGGGWNCPACTFLNENPCHLVCVICGTAKVANNSGDDIDIDIDDIIKNGNTANNNNDDGRSTGTASEDSFAPVRIKNGSFHSQHSKKSAGSRSSSRRKSVSNSGLQHSNERMFAKSASFGGRHSSRRYNDSSSHNNNNHHHHERLYASGTSIGSSNDLHASGGSMNLRHSMGSHASSSRSRRGGGGGGSTRRKGVRRGTTTSNTNEREQAHNNKTTAEIDESLRSSANDSFGSFNSQDQMMHSFKPRGNRGERGGGGGSGGSSLSLSRRGSNEPRLHRSVSHTSSSGGASVTSSRSRASAMSSRSSTNRRGSTKGGGGSSSSTRGRQYRASMSNVDYGHSSSNGHGGGYNSYDDYSGPISGPDVGTIDADSHSDSECSELSDEDDGTIYADDKTARTMQTIKTLRVPHGDVTIIYTDVQGSTSLWEADPLAMKKSTDLHDSIIRKCYADHGGYEITTEGDAFNLAFQHPADAIGFALKAQLALYRAKWPEGILNHPDGCDNEKKKFRGFRVRMGMHHGATASTVHETTGRTIYQGEAVNISKAIEKMSHGGQILTTVETWRTVSGMAEQFLGSPQVMDCGEHLLYDPKKAESAGKKKTKRIFSKRIVQLVPNSLSYDFFAARGGQEVQEGEQPARVCGRVFPPLLSHGQLSTSFLNAPYIGNKVAMVFVYTDKMESVTDKERKKNYKILSKYVRSHLMRLSPPGYECQEDKGSWMLAFDRIENGIKFGLDLKEDVVTSAELFGKVDKERAFRIGIHWGPFLSMGPHTVSGHADYFGPIVNRAARVAAQCEAGQVCVGVPMGDGEEPPDPGPSVDVDVLGVKQLKGISIEMAIFACKKRKSKS